MTMGEPRTTADVRVQQISLPPDDATLDGLADLLVDAVDGGASVSFLGSITRDEALAWWRESLAKCSPRDTLLVARDDEGIVGTVQVRACWQPNQRFRGEIMKLLVHRRARGQGIATDLMRRIEAAALAAGLTLLVLDTNEGTTADRLYQRLGWTRLGVIPGFCLLNDGTPAGAVFFYKHLRGRAEGG